MKKMFVSFSIQGFNYVCIGNQIKSSPKFNETLMVEHNNNINFAEFG